MDLETRVEAIAEIRDCVKAEGAGRFHGSDDDVAWIEFNAVPDAANWIGNYTTYDSAAFEQPPTNFTDPVLVRLSIQAYATAAGL